MFEERSQGTSPASSRKDETPKETLAPGHSFDLFHHRFGDEALVHGFQIQVTDCLTATAEIGFEPGGGLRGKTRTSQFKGFEDRGAIARGPDGTIVLLAIDGVGEVYLSQDKRILYPYKGEERVLGDLPGLILFESVQAAIQDPQVPLRTETALRECIREASKRYQEVLADLGLLDKLDGSKEQVGGCTFSIAVVPPTGPVILGSAGDAIVVARRGNRLVGTRNQLPDTNLAFEPLKDRLKDELAKSGSADPHQDMRVIFNALLKKMQRNEFTNTERHTIDRTLCEQTVAAKLDELPYLTTERRVELRAVVMKSIPASVAGYAFFDGNPAVADAMQVLTLERTEGNALQVVACTDGAFDNGNIDDDAVRRSLFNDLDSGGLRALLQKNQSPGKGPEATALVLRLS